ncbi:hypothetical protein CBR_g30756 [Chara braunii]|uniref:Uncharacterized protein n=1 Tax=Chara braunii TaxID=69332 RepID=A0A388LDK7_CHABU|nr:hypothetical protein CBR_g30756 [Chara braunii]|eukprot:GBG80388.1 hypothetical protein CBR_g30756 [Chara braunii]
MGHVYALDFDGVLCDSCGESSLAAVKAAKVRWPSVLAGISPSVEQWIVDRMRDVRPVVETGYENVLLVRLLLEMKRWQLTGGGSSSVDAGMDGAADVQRVSSVVESGQLKDINGILSGWQSIKPVIMKEWGEEGKREELVDLFGSIRDNWMQTDLAGWLGTNRIYPGVADALRFAASPIYIVTTKQTRFALALLKDLAGVDFPEDRIFGLGTGPKVRVLEQLQSRAEHNGCELHFVEDRVLTLENVIQVPTLSKWHLYLGTWGYNTAEERARAMSCGSGRIQLVDLPTFCAKLK